MTSKELKQAANEINIFFDLDPAIDLNQKAETLERMLILECAPLLNTKKDVVVPFDDITPESKNCISQETINVLTELGTKYKDEIDKTLKENEINVLKFFKIIGSEPAEAEPDPEKVNEGEALLDVADQDLAEEIKSATKLKELKDIANTNEEFKSIRGKLSSYKTVDDLSSDMLELYYAAEQQAKAEEGHEKNIESKAVNEIIEEKKPAATEKAPKEKKEPKVKKEKPAKSDDGDHKTRAQIFAEIFKEGKPLTMAEWTKEMDSRSDSTSIATARTFTSIYMQILLELGVVSKTKDGKLVKA
jgi:hypothetical protein